MNVQNKDKIVLYFMTDKKIRKKKKQNIVIQWKIKWNKEEGHRRKKKEKKKERTWYKSSHFVNAVVNKKK